MCSSMVSELLQIEKKHSVFLQQVLCRLTFHTILGLTHMARCDMVLLGLSCTILIRCGTLWRSTRNLPTLRWSMENMPMKKQWPLPPLQANMWLWRIWRRYVNRALALLIDFTQGKISKRDIHTWSDIRMSREDKTTMWLVVSVFYVEILNPWQ